MFKCPLSREQNNLNYAFENAVFVVESFNYDVRRKSINVRVSGFADQVALESYLSKINAGQFHDLEKSMIFNRHFDLNVVDVVSHDTPADDCFVQTLNAIELALIEKEEMFKNGQPI